MSNIFASSLQSAEQKGTGWEQVFFDLSIGQGDRAGTVLTLRQYPTGTGFVRTVNCAPGQLTVLTGDYETDSKHFRDALIGRPSSIPVSIRYGSDEVSASEIFSVGIYDSLAEDLSALKAIERMHVPAEAARALLTQARLSPVENTIVREMDEASRKQLNILAGLFSRTRFIFFDRPFVNLPAASVEPIAGLILRMAQLSKRIVIITGVDKVPDVWQDSRDVQFASQENKEDKPKARTKTKTLTLRIQREIEPEAADAVRSMIQGNRTTAESGEFIFTRPMIINPSGARMPGGGRLQNERIANPHIAEINGSPEANNTSAPRARATRDSARHKRPNTGTLTRVSYWEVIKHRVIGQDLLDLPKKLKNAFSAAEHGSGASGLPLSTVAKSPVGLVKSRQAVWIALGLALLLAMAMYYF